MAMSSDRQKSRRVGKTKRKRSLSSKKTCKKLMKNGGSGKDTDNKMSAVEIQELTKQQLRDIYGPKKKGKKRKNADVTLPVSPQSPVITEKMPPSPDSNLLLNDEYELPFIDEDSQPDFNLDAHEHERVVFPGYDTNILDSPVYYSPVDTLDSELEIPWSDRKLTTADDYDEWSKLSHNRPQELFANSNETKHDTRKVVNSKKLNRDTRKVVKSKKKSDTRKVVNPKKTQRDQEKLKYKPIDMTTVDDSYLRAVVRLSPETLSNMSGDDITKVVKDWRIRETERRGIQRRAKLSKLHKANHIVPAAQI